MIGLYYVNGVDIVSRLWLRSISPGSTGRSPSSRGSRGLGREISTAFAEQGATVVVVSRKADACTHARAHAGQAARQTGERLHQNATTLLRQALRPIEHPEPDPEGFPA